MDSRRRGGQALRFCRAPDGVRIAYAVHGDGPPPVMAPSWISHLERDWSGPVWGHHLRELGRMATVIRYNERGYGLSDRDVSDFSLEARDDLLPSLTTAEICVRAARARRRIDVTGLLGEVAVRPWCCRGQGQRNYCMDCIHAIG